MPAQATQPQPDSTSRFAALLGDAGGITKVKAPAQGTVKIEPTMRALRRILGDSVLEILPEGIIENTDKLFDLCSEDTSWWAEIPCESVAERNDLLALMKAYAECAADEGYTVTQDRTAEPTVLRVRVIPRKSRKSDGDE